MIQKFLALTTIALLPAVTLAAREGAATQKSFAGMVQSLGGLAQGVIFLIAAMSIFAFLWGLATSMMRLGTDAKQVQRAKDFMVWGTVGFVVMGSMYGILEILRVTVTSVSSGG